MQIRHLIFALEKKERREFLSGRQIESEHRASGDFGANEELWISNCDNDEGGSGTFPSQKLSTIPRVSLFSIRKVVRRLDKCLAVLTSQLLSVFRFSWYADSLDSIRFERAHTRSSTFISHWKFIICTHRTSMHKSQFQVATTRERLKWLLGTAKRFPLWALVVGWFFFLFLFTSQHFDILWILLVALFSLSLYDKYDIKYCNWHFVIFSAEHSRSHSTWR